MQLSTQIESSVQYAVNLKNIAVGVSVTVQSSKRYLIFVQRFPGYIYVIFSSVLEDCMKSKNTSCYFQHKFSTFNACQKYLTLPPLQLVLEAYLIRCLAKSAAFRLGLVFCLSFWSLPCLSSFKTN